MTSPRFCGFGLQVQKHMLGWLATVAAVLTAAPCLAQTTGTGRDSAAVGTTGSARVDTARTDTARTDTARTDTARTDTARADTARADTAARAPGDTLPRPRGDSAKPPTSPAPPPEPVDSVLGAACKEAADSPPDVLLVTFQPSATESDRSAVAREVGGTLLGMSQHAAPGSWYLRAPGSSLDPSVADRLIRLPPVVEVGSTRCPS